MDDRTRVRRQPHRGIYDRAELLTLIDGLPVASVGYCAQGRPYVYPTLAWREGDHLYWHGSAASHSLRHIAEGVELCVNLFAVDGLVLARSGMNSSVNYRSVTLFGRAEAIVDADSKRRALERFIENLVPGRWVDLRPITVAELKATTVVRMAIDEASGKVRNGPAHDDEADYALDIWAGVVPLALEVGAPVADPRLRPGVAEPQYLADLEFGEHA